MSSNHITKMCSKCKCTLAGSFFHKSKSNKDGLHCWCKSCYSSYVKKQRSDPAVAQSIKERQSNWYLKNRDDVLLKQSSYNKLNRNQINEYRKKWLDERLKTDDVFRFSFQVRLLISNSIRRRGFTKSSRSHQILGCGWSEFMSHIESLFSDGMTWENKGEWEIDHIIPISSAETCDDVLRLNHYSNMRPLWRAHNRSKGAKLDYVIPTS